MARKLMSEQKRKFIEEQIALAKRRRIHGKQSAGQSSTLLFNRERQLHMSEMHKTVHRVVKPHQPAPAASKAASQNHWKQLSISGLRC